jgi:hypothetical protein
VRAGTLETYRIYTEGGYQPKNPKELHTFNKMDATNPTFENWRVNDPRNPKELHTFDEVAPVLLRT